MVRHRWITLIFTVSLFLGIFSAAFGETYTAQYPWATGAAKVLVDPYVRTVLLIIGMLGIMVEIITLSAVAGTVGIVSLVLFFLSHIVLGMTQWWVILVFFAGIIFLAIEIYVVPGHGISGIIGLIATFVSLFIAMNNPQQAILSLLISTAVSVGLFFLILKYLPKSKAWNKIILTNEQTEADGYTSFKRRVDLEGAYGVTLTDLRPAGIALINNERVDVVSEGNFIKKDTPIRVIKVEDLKIVVAETEREW